MNEEINEGLPEWYLPPIFVFEKTIRVPYDTAIKWQHDELQSQEMIGASGGQVVRYQKVKDDSTKTILHVVSTPQERSSWFHRGRKSPNPKVALRGTVFITWNPFRRVEHLDFFFPTEHGTAERKQGDLYGRMQTTRTLVRSDEDKTLYHVECSVELSSSEAKMSWPPQQPNFIERNRLLVNTTVDLVERKYGSRH